MTAIGFDASDAGEVGTTQEAGVIKLAILAIGGQGGGVITDWIVATAERNGWLAQSTSVPGVAQRTGATIYYVEMAPGGGPVPVMALAPAPGDVDIVVAAELMEAGRAVQRGFVTPETTTLIASTHRAYGILEKSAPGDGIGDAAAVTEILLRSAKRLILADMETLARDKGSVISASLFGALAAAAVLPFSRESYEQTIRDSGKGVTASLAAFADGWQTVRDPQDPDPLEPRPQKVRSRPEPVGTAELSAAYHRLVHRIETGFPEAAQDMLLAGLEKVVDYQDIGYGRQYLDRVAEVSALDAVDRGALLTVEAAKYVANAMAYDDVIRVADLKTRGSRALRVREEAGVGDNQVLKVTEYMHPRAEEVCGLLPRRLGAFLEARPKWMARLDRLVNRGRRVRTDTLFWFLVLYTLGGLRLWRRRLLRHAHETQHIEDWLHRVKATAPRNYALAVEILRCRRLIKGYSDTHARGLSKYDKVLSSLPALLDRSDGGDWLRRLRDVALKDEEGSDLEGALKTVESL